MGFVVAIQIKNVLKLYFLSKFLLGIIKPVYIPTSQAKSIWVTISPVLALKNLE